MRPEFLLFLQSGLPGAGGPGSGSSFDFATLFTRIGKGLYLVNLANQFRGAPGSYLPTNLPLRWDSYVSQFDGEEAALRSAVDGATDELSAAIAGLDGLTSWVSTSLTATVISMADAFSRLTSEDLPTGLAAVVGEMILADKFVKANTVTVTTEPVATNKGNGLLATSTLDGSGDRLEFAYDELLPLFFTSTGVVGSEQAQILGTVAAAALLDVSWPGGSGANVQLTSVDAAQGGNNLLQGGGFETFTSNVPASWTIEVGGAGTQILKETTHVYAGSSSLAIVGDGTTLTRLVQQVSNLASKRPYAVNCWIELSATPASGVLVLELFDGTSVINDENGAPNQLSIDLTAGPLSFQPQNVFFRLAEPVPATVYFRIRLSSALSAGATLYLDHLSMVAATQLYAGGPFVALFGGSVGWCLDDAIEVRVSNDFAGGLQTGCWRLFNLPQLGLSLPSKTDGSENISDALIA